MSSASSADVGTSAYHHKGCKAAASIEGEDCVYQLIQAAGCDSQVTVEEVQQVRRQGEFLGRHITKFKEIVRDLAMPPPTPAEGGVAARPRPALTGY